MTCPVNADASGRDWAFFSEILVGGSPPIKRRGLGRLGVDRGRPQTRPTQKSEATRKPCRSVTKPSVDEDDSEERISPESIDHEFPIARFHVGSPRRPGRATSSASIDEVGSNAVEIPTRIVSPSRALTRRTATPSASIPG